MSRAAVELERLRESRRKVAVFKDQVEADLRKAAEDLAEAKQTLAELEADAAAGTVTAKQRAEVERRLAEAEARRDEPWPERLDGARAALDGANRELVLFAGEHVDQLIEDAEKAVAPAVARLNVLALELSTAIQECHNAAAGIAQTLALAGIRPRPGAVTRMQTDELSAALGVFTHGGGQPEVRLDRRLVPALDARDQDPVEAA